MEHIYSSRKIKSCCERDINYIWLLHDMGEVEYEHLFVDGTKLEDPDATFMHMKEDHMRNAQLKPGYNVQLGAEGEYITGVLVSPKRSDQLTLIPLLEKMRSYGAEYTDVTADAGYESEENYSWFETAEKECYIKPRNVKRFSSA